MDYYYNEFYDCLLWNLSSLNLFPLWRSYTDPIGKSSRLDTFTHVPRLHKSSLKCTLLTPEIVVMSSAACLPLAVNAFTVGQFSSAFSFKTQEFFSIEE
ncbi:hypothetical protein VNO77_25247 [Canavalia gladiata]|uniref:Uncharacterized protein n=1 Tax=Canavalia gladiata TaxID=3824 RepID=A0AAN9QGY3_CANGL